MRPQKKRVAPYIVARTRSAAITLSYFLVPSILSSCFFFCFPSPSLRRNSDPGGAVAKREPFSPVPTTVSTFVRERVRFLFFFPLFDSRPTVGQQQHSRFFAVGALCCTLIRLSSGRRYAAKQKDDVETEPHLKHLQVSADHQRRNSRPTVEVSSACRAIRDGMMMYGTHMTRSDCAAEPVDSPVLPICSCREIIPQRAGGRGGGGFEGRRVALVDGGALRMC